jgi:AcrR family transcriptional regulator
MYFVYQTCTLYGCQVAGERLTKAAVAERALRLGDEEGLEAVTIRRLAQELGVTPMALYWHFKNKDELMVGIVDHALSTVRADRAAADPWQKQLRAMVEALIRAMREHPALADLMHNVAKEEGESFTRASNDALVLLTAGGFGIEEAYWVASHLLHAAIGLVAAQPDCPMNIPAAEAAEWRRQKRLKLESLPADKYPLMVAFAASYARVPDIERYYSFGIDLVMAGVEALAPGSAQTTGEELDQTIGVAPA